MLKEKLEKLVSAMSEDELLQLHNEYCSNVNMDDYIYSMDEFNDIFSGSDILDVVNMCHFGDFNPCNEYFKFNGYGNLDSFDSFDADDYIYPEDIIDYIIDNEDSLYIDEIEELLEEYSE